MAGLASNVPDLDGLPMLFDMQRFEAGHRVWGHNIVAIILSSLLLGWTQFRFSWIDKMGAWIATKISALIKLDWTTDATEPRIGVLTCASIAMLAQMLHLPCDMVVSGGNGLSDWAIQPFWPFSHTGYVYPMIPWGDVGPTVIMMTGIIFSAKHPTNLSMTSLLTLIALCAYLFARAWARGLLVV